MQPETDSRKSDRWEGPGHWLAEAFEQSLGRALESMAGAQALAGASFRTLRADPEAWSAWPAPLWYRMALADMAGGAVWTGCGIETVTALGRLVAGDPSLAEAQCRDAYREVLHQTAAAAGDLASMRLGKRVSFSPWEAAEAPCETEFAVHLESVFGGATHLIALVPNPALMQGLDGALQAPPPASSSESAQVSATRGAAVAQGGAASPGPPRNLDLLLEVELPVCVTFGRTQLPLKDVLKLSSGSIVELNRLANEPVEVLINDCVIARGEVVVVDGNYGIRVTEIVSRQERIRSIF